MKLLCAALFAWLFVVTSAFAACSSFEFSRMNQIVLQAQDYGPELSPSPIWIIGDSHTAMAATAFPDGLMYKGHPVVFAGIAGATFSDFRDCFPFDSIEATWPAGVVFMLGFNDAHQNVCCSATTPYPATATETYLISYVVERAQLLSANVVIATDPAQVEGSALALSYRTYAVATAIRDAVGGRRFVDFYRYGTAVYCFVPVPYCATRSTALTDGIHYPPELYVRMVQVTLTALGI